MVHATFFLGYPFTNCYLALTALLPWHLTTIHSLKLHQLDLIIFDLRSEANSLTANATISLRIGLSVSTAKSIGIPIHVCFTDVLVRLSKLKCDSHLFAIFFRHVVAMLLDISIVGRFEFICWQTLHLVLSRARFFRLATVHSVGRAFLE